MGVQGYCCWLVQGVARLAGNYVNYLGAQMALAFGSRISLVGDVEKDEADGRSLSDMPSPFWHQLQEWLLDLRLGKFSQDCDYAN